MNPDRPQSPLPQHRSHPRTYLHNKYVYPVLSRRSGGISIGVNLNPDKVCNFGCIYCQVDRTTTSETKFVGFDELMDELDHMLLQVRSGRLFEDEQFASVPEPLRRLNDIAFSGDGEPTTYRNFDRIIEQVADLKRSHGLDDVKMVLITNATMLHRPHVQRGLEILDANNGEIWAKLEAGTDEYYHLIEQTVIPFRQVLDNITAAAQQRPLVIQSLFMQVHGEGPDDAEIDAYIGRLEKIVTAGGAIQLVQVYTVARPPAESFVTPLSDGDIDAIAQRVRARTGLTTRTFYGR